MNKFSEKYKLFSNSELLRIVDNSADYQDTAVKAAQIELENRKLSNIELEEARQINEKVQIENKKSLEKKIEHRKKFIKILESVFENINPIQKDTPSPNKWINIISIIYSVFFIYLFVKSFNLIKFIITSSPSDWSTAMLFYIFPLVILLIGVIFFWKHKKIGWYFLSIFIIYQAVDKIYSFYIEFSNSFEYSVLDELFPSTSPIVYLAIIFFYVGSIWTISLPKVRMLFTVKKIDIINSILIGILISYIFIKFF